MTTGAYCRQTRTARSTGATVSIFDTRHPNNVFSDDGGRWVTFCETHELLVNHESLELARSFAAAPEQWCDDCQVIFYGHPQHP